MSLINDLIMEMIDYYQNDPKRIQHFIKAHSFAKLIAEEENIDKNKQLVVEIASLVHDIGIRNALAKYKTSIGYYQEQEGLEEAKKMLTNLNIDEAIIDRVCYILLNNRSFEKIDDIDFQIVVEAHLLVNYYEDSLPRENILYSYDKVFKTETGKLIAEKMFKMD